MEKCLKSGKVPQAVLDRSVLRPLKLQGVAGAQDVYGADAAAMGRYGAAGMPGTAAGDSVMAGTAGDSTVSETGTHMSSGCVTGPYDPTVGMYLAEQCNSLAAAGYRLRQLWVSLVLPAGEDEQTLRNMMDEMARWCLKKDVQICGGHTCVSEGVARPVLSLAGTGEAIRRDVTVKSALQESHSDLRERLRDSRDSAAENHSGRLVCVMAGPAGCAGTGLLARACGEALRKYFPSVMIDEALRMSALETDADTSLCMDQIAGQAWQLGALAMHDVSYNGVFGALWELAAREQAGFEIDLKKIPIRQETIEICEWYDLNPYQLYGQGALLIIMPEKSAGQLKHFLRKQEREVPVALSVIGTINGGNQKILRNGDDIRFLDKPQRDALFEAADREMP